MKLQMVLSESNHFKYNEDMYGQPIIEYPIWWLKEYNNQVDGSKTEHDL